MPTIPQIKKLLRITRMGGKRPGGSPCVKTFAGTL
jgi:hypothetical protein